MQNMVISKTLFTSKKLSDNTHPIMIRFQQDGKTKYLSTGFKTNKSYWNKKSGLTQKGREKDNLKIDGILLKYQERLNAILQKGLEPTFELVMSDTPLEEKPNPSSSNFIDIISLKIKDVEAKYNTRKEYEDLKNLLIQEYGDYINVDKVNQIWFDDFKAKLSKIKGDKNRLKNVMCQKFKTCYQFGAARDMIKNYRPLTNKPFKYERDKSKLNLTPNEYAVILAAYKKDCVAQARELKANDKDAIMLFALHVAFQGIAPVDMARIKVGDIEIKKIKKYEVNQVKFNNDSNYRMEMEAKQEEREVVLATLKRKKSSVTFTICADAECCKPLIEYYIEGKSKEEYLLPIMEKEMTDEQFTKKVGNYYTNKIKRLNAYMKRFCEIWDEYEQPKHITYYHARHAFVNLLFHDSQQKYTIAQIKNMVGQVTDDVLLNFYVDETSLWNQSEATRDIFNQDISIAELMQQRTH